MKERATNSPRSPWYKILTVLVTLSSLRHSIPSLKEERFTLVRVAVRPTAKKKEHGTAAWQRESGTRHGRQEAEREGRRLGGRETHPGHAPSDKTLPLNRTLSYKSISGLIHQCV